MHNHVPFCTQILFRFYLLTTTSTGTLSLPYGSNFPRKSLLIDSIRQLDSTRLTRVLLYDQRYMNFHDVWYYYTLNLVSINESATTALEDIYFRPRMPLYLQPAERIYHIIIRTVYLLFSAEYHDDESYGIAPLVVGPHHAGHAASGECWIFQR